MYDRAEIYAMFAVLKINRCHSAPRTVH